MIIYSEQIKIWKVMVMANMKALSKHSLERQKKPQDISIKIADKWAEIHVRYSRI
jgi:type II secretory ATPase GspE/PulE/Tfp pilus assembly ATPase PilB-like protein